MTAAEESESKHRHTSTTPLMTNRRASVEVSVRVITSVYLQRLQLVPPWLTYRQLHKHATVISISLYENFNQLNRAKLAAQLHKSSSGDEIPKRDVTYHLIC